MTGSLLWSLVAGMTVFLALHIGLWRASPSNNPRILLLGLLVGVGLAVSVLVDLILNRTDALEWCAVLWINGFLGVLYLVFYSALARSVSLTLLIRLWQAGPPPPAMQALVEEYTSSNRFEDRIQLMHDSGFTRPTAGSIALTGRGVLMARWARGLGRVLGHGLEG
jgi:hypothetical protein